jgi:hypothetical protein
MLLLVLMLDDPDLTDRVLQAWLGIGIRGAHLLESAACRLPEEESTRASTGFLSFAHLLPAGRACSALLLAPVDSTDTAERAAAEVARIAGAWGERRTATLLALPVAASWGGLATGAEELGRETADGPPLEPQQPLDAP